MQRGVDVLLDNAMRKTRSFCDDKEEGDWLGREDRPTMWLHCGEEEAERETELGTTVHEQAYRDFHSIDYEWFTLSFLSYWRDSVLRTRSYVTT